MEKNTGKKNLCQNFFDQHFSFLLGKREKFFLIDRQGNNILHKVFMLQDVFLWQDFVKSLVEENNKKRGDKKPFSVEGVFSHPLWDQPNHYHVTPRQMVLYLAVGPLKDVLLHYEKNPFQRVLKSKRTILLKKEGKTFSLAVEEFEKEMELSYLPSLQFADTGTLFAIGQQLKKKEQKGKIGKREKWRGTYFEKEMQTGHVADIGIQWIDHQKEYGVFAQRHLKKGTFVAEYTGIVRRSKTYLDKKNPYCFEYVMELGKETSFTIDAREYGNEARFVNHSNTPNLEPQAVFVDGFMHIILKTRCAVMKGTELTYDYGPDYWRQREAPV